MTIDDLRSLIQNRINYMQAQRTHAVAIGDLQRVERLDADITETEATLAQLMTL